MKHYVLSVVIGAVLGLFIAAPALLVLFVPAEAEAQLAHSSSEQSLDRIARSLERLASRPQQVQQPCRCECGR